MAWEFEVAKEIGQRKNEFYVDDEPAEVEEEPAVETPAPEPEERSWLDEPDDAFESKDDPADEIETEEEAEEDAEKRKTSQDAFSRGVGIDPEEGKPQMKYNRETKTLEDNE